MPGPAASCRRTSEANEGSPAHLLRQAIRVVAHPGPVVAGEYVRGADPQAHAPQRPEVALDRGRLLGIHGEQERTRDAAEEAAPVEVDREVLRGSGIRVREADLLSEDAAAGVRHDPGRLAEEVCGAALVRL